MPYSQLSKELYVRFSPVLYHKSWHLLTIMYIMLVLHSRLSDFLFILKGTLKPSWANVTVQHPPTKTATVVK